MRRATHKYNAKPTVVDGIRFDSQREARRYQELKLLEKAGEITGLDLQPRFTLEVRDLREPLHHTATLKVGEYWGDFGYWERASGKYVVEDAKGFKTPLYKWKKKHVEAQYGIRIREV